MKTLAPTLSTAVSKYIGLERVDFTFGKDHVEKISMYCWIDSSGKRRCSWTEAAARRAVAEEQARSK